MEHANDNAPTGLRYLSVCSGIEAASVAWHPLGWRAVAYSEIEKFPSAVLAHHYPDVPNLGDFTKIDTATLGKVDILAGGTPCQAFSVAGSRRSLDDARGNLTLAFVDIAHALADGNGLRNVVWENVPGVLSTKDNAFGCFLAGLVGADSAIVPNGRWSNAGMVSGPKGRAAWRVLDAQYFGLAQRRKRVIVVADFGNGADPAAVLFEPESVRRDSPPSREAGQGIAGTIAGGARKGGGYSHDDVPLTAYAPEIARCDATREGSSQDYESTTMVACVTGDITHALTAEGHDASEDGSGRGAPIVCFSAKDYGADASVDIAPTLRAGGHTGSHANAGVMPAICFDTTQITSAANRSNPKAGGTGHPLSAQAHPPAICAHETGQGWWKQEDVAGTLRAEGENRPSRPSHVVAARQSAVRRLTPRECERLQGFPDGWTRIPIRHYATKKITKNRPEDMWEKCPDGGWWLMSADGPRYKSLGNSWAIPVFRWLGKRLDEAYKSLPLGQNRQAPLREANRLFFPANDAPVHAPQRNQKHAS